MANALWNPKGSDRRLASVELPRERKEPLPMREWEELLEARVQAMVEADLDAQGTVKALLVDKGVLSSQDLPQDRAEWGRALVSLLGLWVLEQDQEWPAKGPFRGSRRPASPPTEESLGAWIGRVRSKLPREE